MWKQYQGSRGQKYVEQEQGDKAGLKITAPVCQ